MKLDGRQQSENTNEGLFQYVGYQLKIHSYLYLPELSPVPVPSSEFCDIQITLGDVESHPENIDEAGRGFWVEGDQACYSLRDVGTFLVTAGRHILVEPHSQAPEEALRLCILGPALGLALHQRGFFTLHASAVAVAGAGVAFLGGHAWGKSTMAAILRERGHALISDDLTALEQSGKSIVPAFPQLKLWPDALSSLGCSPAVLPQVHPALEKRALRFKQGFATSSVPLRRLYILAIGETVTIESIPPTQAFEDIVCHWYGARFGPDFVKSLDLRQHFLRIAQLARTVPVRRLQRPATLLSDPGLAGAIEYAILEDLGAS
ncbi:MAG: hypothetical protein R3F53_04315 [Gammaproteobacteria bacterium]